SFLDFVDEPEQFYWFVEHFLSVKFRVPKHLKDKNIHNFTPCLNRSWVSEFLKEYEEPFVNPVMKFLDKEQRLFFTYNFGDVEPQEEYKVFLSSVGSQMTAIKNLYSTVEDEQRKQLLKVIIENESTNDISVQCPTYNIKLHYTKECANSNNILKCIDEFLRKTCEKKTESKHPSADLCEHLQFLFESLKNPYLDNFKKFMTNSDFTLIKPQSVWNVPIFDIYKPKNYLDSVQNLDTECFKKLNSKNLIFLSFHDDIPNNPYYNVELQEIVKLSTYTYSIFDKLYNFFFVFKKSGAPISPVSVKELSHNITDFSFKEDNSEIQCQNVRKSLDLEVDVETMKGIAAEKLCKIIEKFILTKDDAGKPEKSDIHRGFRILCILISTHVEAYNIVRQLLNMESMISLTRYTSLYIHKFFKSVTLLKGNFLYKNNKAIRYSRACSKASLHVPSVLYRRNIYIPETFLSLYLGLSNLVSSNPSSPFFEYAIIEFLVTYYNKGSEKFVLYFISIISVLYINEYYYEQLSCFYPKEFELIKSRMIHPNIVDRILKGIDNLMKSTRYDKMRTMYLDFESSDIFSREKVFTALYNFDSFIKTNEQLKKKNLEEISEIPVQLETSNDGIGYRKQDVLYETDKPQTMDEASYEETVDEDAHHVNEKQHSAHFLDAIAEKDILEEKTKDQDLEIELYKYMGPLKEQSKSTSAASTSDELSGSEGPSTESTSTGNQGEDKTTDNTYKEMEELEEAEGTSNLKKGLEFYKSSLKLDQLDKEKPKKKKSKRKKKRDSSSDRNIIRRI
ncbi:rhoptry protein, partial [Plasmodium falciparum RAJ116]